MIDGIWQDVRYSLRMIRRSPGFAAMAVLILGLGIGASAAAFSVVNAVFFKPLAVPEPDRLVYVFSVSGNGHRYPQYGLSAVNFFDGHFDKAFSGVTAHSMRVVTMAADGEASPTQGELVTANYFDVLGVKPLMGRTFRPQEDDPTNTSLAVVLSHDLWNRRFKGDPNIVGRDVRLDDRMFSVIGVMPSGFEGLSDPWRPSRFWVCFVQLDPFGGISAVNQAAARRMLGIVARLKPGLRLDEAQAVVNVHGTQMQIEVMRETPNRMWKPTRQVVVPAPSVTNPFMPDEWAIHPQLLWAITLVVAIVLLIAATNIAGVLAARGVTRAQEVAVRQALGAGTGRLVRQLLSESIVIALAGGAFGLVVAQIIVAAYETVAPSRFFVDVTFDGRVALFILAVCVGAGVLVGLAPALQSRRVDVVAALAGGVGSGSRRVRRRLRHAILLPQVALSVVLLVVAGVHVRSLSTIEIADVGHRIDGIITMRAGHWDGRRWVLAANKEDADKRRERDRAFYLSLFRSVSAIETEGGVAIASSPLPPQTSMPGHFINEADFAAKRAPVGRADWLMVSPGYFRTMGMRLVEGRDFDARETLASKPVAIVSEAFARQLWPSGNAVGQSLAWYFQGQKAPPWWLEVVGIVNETRPVLQDLTERPMLYTDLVQGPPPYSYYVVAAERTDPVGATQRLSAAIAAADDFAEVSSVRSLSQVVGELLYPRRAAVGILVASGIVGLILASIGIYGVISHSVAQRLQEIGIRATLGADRRDILALVLREAAAVTLAGALPGMWLGLLALRMTANVVGKLPTFDLLTFIVVPVATMAVILAASYLPARRAARLNPMTVLRGQ